MNSPNEYAFMILLCSEDGTVIYSDPRLPLSFSKQGTAFKELRRRTADAGNRKLVQTKDGLIEFSRIVSRSFQGYIGVLFRERDDVVCKLEEMNKELEAIFESSHDGIVVADENGRFIRVNSSYERITGVPRNEVLNATAESIVEKGLVSDSATVEVLKTGLPCTFSQTFRSGRQSIITGSPVFDSENKVFRVVTNVRDMTEINRLRAELAESQEKITHYSRIVETLTEEQMSNESLIFRSRKMAAVRSNAIKFAKVDSPILITGESGVGKEVIADLIYKNSLRKGGPFLKINCGAIPETLLESELFGYEGGAFTGAKRDGRTGLFEVANKGTVMLDEIGELSLTLQVKLLRFIQDGEFYRVGGNKTVKVDVRLIAATNQDLQEMVSHNQFRLDLYYRLNVLTIRIPALRERSEDIIPLATYFLGKYNKKYRLTKRFSSELYRFLERNQWAGNVRELENLIERLVVISDREEITLDSLPEEIKTSYLSSQNINDVCMCQSYKEAKEAFEKEYLRRVIEKYKSTRSAAENIGIDHSTIVKKAAKYGILLPMRRND